VSPEDLRAEAAWLLNLSGSRCAWPIETLRDLRDYAESVANDDDDDDLTGAEVRSVEEVVARYEKHNTSFTGDFGRKIELFRLKWLFL
jgi:hypothetical protein